MTRKNIINLLLSGIFMAGCGRLYPGTPPLDDSTTVQLLVDIHLLQSRARTIGDLKPQVFDSLLAIKGISVRQYQETMFYYREHPEDYIKVYDDALSRLQNVTPSWNPQQDTMAVPLSRPTGAR